MVTNLRASFSTLIDGNTWLSDEDKVTAHEKLAAVEEFVAYPDWIMDDASITAAYEGVSWVSSLPLDLTKVDDNLYLCIS